MSTQSSHLMIAECICNCDIVNIHYTISWSCILAMLCLSFIHPPQHLHKARCHLHQTSPILFFTLVLFLLPLFLPSPSATSCACPDVPPLIQSVQSSVPSSALPAGQGQRLPEGRTGVAAHTSLNTQLPVAFSGHAPNYERMHTYIT